jgi:hypothetical protein
MTFSRVKGQGWATNEKVKSPQLNQLDLDHSRALDKTGDTVAGGGGILGAIDLASGASLTTKSGSTVTQASGSTWTLDGYCNVFGGVTFNPLSNILNYGIVGFQSGSDLSMNSGSLIQVQSGATLQLVSGCTLTAALGSGSSLALGNGSSLSTTGSATTSIGGTLAVSGLSTISNGMTFSGAALTLNSSSSLTASSGCVTTLTGQTFYAIKTTSSNYTVDSSQSDNYLLVSTTGGAVTITIPSATFGGRVLTIKDNGGQAGTHAITIQPSSGTIEGNASIQITNNYGFFTLLATGGTTWNIVGADKNESP